MNYLKSLVKNNASICLLHKKTSIALLWKLKNLTSQAHGQVFQDFQVGSSFVRGLPYMAEVPINNLSWFQCFSFSPSSLFRAQAGFWFSLVFLPSSLFIAQAGYWFSLVLPSSLFKAQAGFWFFLWFFVHCCFTTMVGYYY